MVRYEDLVAAPAHWIRVCASLLSIDVSSENTERVAARHSFDTFELTTGIRPFQGNSRMLLRQVIEEEPPIPTKLNNHIPRDLETI